MLAGERYVIRKHSFSFHEELKNKRNYLAAITDIRGVYFNSTQQQEEEEDERRTPPERGATKIYKIALHPMGHKKRDSKVPSWHAETLKLGEEG